MALSADLGNKFAQFDCILTLMKIIISIYMSFEHKKSLNLWPRC